MMPDSAALSGVTFGTASQGGFLLVLAVALPIAGVLLALAFGGHLAARIARFVLPTGLGLALAIVAEVWHTRDSLVYFLGGWMPPLGLAFRADGISAAMLLTTAIVVCATGVYAGAGYRMPTGKIETRAPLASGSS